MSALIGLVFALIWLHAGGFDPDYGKENQRWFSSNQFSSPEVNSEVSFQSQNEEIEYRR
jgi:hypothetical protein